MRCKQGEVSSRKPLDEYTNDDDSAVSRRKTCEEICQAHLSFVERYHKDLICPTKGNGVVEHPVNIAKSLRCLTDAHKDHSKRPNWEETQ